MPRKVVGTTKRCTRCGKMLPRSAFSRQRYHGPNSLRGECKKCQYLIRAKWEVELTPEKRARLEQQKRESMERRKAKLRKESRKERDERIDLVQRIITGLRERGWSWREMAERTGVNRTTLLRYAKGEVRQTPHRDVADRLSAFYVELLAREKDERKGTTP